MKANEGPDRIFLEKEKETDRIHHLWGRTPVVSSLYEHIEYVKKDAFIEKAKEFIWSHTEGSDYHVNYVLKEFENFMKGE